MDTAIYRQSGVTSTQLSKTTIKMRQILIGNFRRSR